ncbi:hypothetical protein HK104_003951 [Borealophlyctis nickersoniae]|nr:hypothetical protein HK104_003951 [Borealophlyctis nickersoniae]
MLTLVLFVPIVLKPTKKSAFLIGTDNYPKFPLTGAVNDAKAVGAVLESFGFDVVYALDMDGKEMRQRIVKFGYERVPGDLAVENYLDVLDNGNKATRATGVKQQRLSNLVSHATNDGEKDAYSLTTIFLIDACRVEHGNVADDGSQFEMPVVAKDGSQNMFVFAAEAGRVARETGNHGAFTASLLKFLGQKDMDFETVIKNTRRDLLVKTKDGGDPQMCWTHECLHQKIFLAAGVREVRNDEVRKD